MNWAGIRRNGGHDHADVTGALVSRINPAGMISPIAITAVQTDVEFA